MGLHGLHVPGHLEGQAAPGRIAAKDHVQHGGTGDAVIHQQGVDLRLKLAHHHGVGQGFHHNDGFRSHGLAAAEDVVQVAFVVGGVGLAAIAAVGEALPEIAPCDAGSPGGFGGIGPILQGDGQVAVAAGLPVRLGIGVAGRAFGKHDGHVGLLGGIHPHAVAGDDLLRHGIDVPGGDVLAEKALGGPHVPHGHIDFKALFQGQHALVFKQCDAAALGFLAVAAEFLAAHHPGGFLGVQIGVLKQAAAEDIDQQSGGGLAEALRHGFLADLLAAQAVGRHHGGGIAVAAKLVHAVQDGRQHALRLRGAVHAVAAAAEAVHLRVGVLGDAPVGAYHALKAVFFPQQIADQVGVVAVAHVFVVLGVQVPGHGVIRHHGGGTARGAVQVESGLRKGLFVLGGVVRRIYRVSAEGIMGVAAPFAGAAAGPMLHHGVDAVAAPAVGSVFRGLHAVAVGPHALQHARRIHTQGVHEAHPPGLGAQVDLRAQGRGDAQGAVFPAGVPGKLAYHLGIKAGGEAHALRPFAHVAACGFELRVGVPAAVAGIGGQVDGNAVGQALGLVLQLVAPPGAGGGVLDTHQQDVTDVLLAQKALLLVGQGVGRLAGGRPFLAVKGARKPRAGWRRHHLVRGIEHESGDLLGGQPGRQVRRSLFGGEPPVLVGQQRARAGQILEIQAVLFNKPDAGVLIIGQSGAVGLGEAGGSGGHG